MVSGPMIILAVAFQNPAEMIFIAHDFDEGLRLARLAEPAPINTFSVSFAKTSSPLFSISWEMECNVVEPGYLRSRRGIFGMTF